MNDILRAAVLLATLSLTACGGSITTAPPDATSSSGSGGGTVTPPLPAPKQAAPPGPCQNAPTLPKPATGCDFHCVVEAHPGESPVAVYAWSSVPPQVPMETPVVNRLLAVTDTYVLAVAVWGSASSGTGTWGLLEIPRAGGAPVIVDAWGQAKDGYWATAVLGEDGYVYLARMPYAVSPSNAPGITFERVPAAPLGAAATVLATAPPSNLNVTMALDADHVYASGEWGILRFPRAGGATETLATAIWEYDQPGSFALAGGSLFFVSSMGTLLRMPVAGGKPAPIAAAEQMGGLVAAGGAGPWLFVAGGQEVTGSSLDGADQQALFSSETHFFEAPVIAGSRLFVLERCESVPDGPSSRRTRFYDTTNGETGVLEDDPDYPLVATPPGWIWGLVLPDATGTTFYYPY